MDQSRASNVENVSYTPSTLRPATGSVLGGIKIGAGLNVTADGTASVKIATKLVAGMVKIGTGLAVAADGTVSVLPPDTSTDPATVGTPTNNSLVFGRLDLAKSNYGENPFRGVTETDWTNFGVSLRVPTAGSYRFRIIGALYYYVSSRGNPVAGMLRIYVNGVNSSAADIAFPVPNLATVGSGNTDVYRDITGLNRGDKIELYHKWVTNPDLNVYNAGVAIFTVLIAGENCHGIHALADYSLSTTTYPGIVQPITGLSYSPPPPPTVTGIDGGS
jgi:hypothetical protein